MRVGPTAEATARYTSEHCMVENNVIRAKDTLDRKISDLMSHLYFDAKCGQAAAEYNLEKAGMIEMIFDQVAGEMRVGDNYWNDIRWMLTELGRRTKLTELRSIILRDPPLEIAVRDAEDEATDISGRRAEPVFFGVDTVTLHERILAHLDERVERIRGTQSPETQ
jgi:hypothetical protein